MVKAWTDENATRDVADKMFADFTQKVLIFGLCLINYIQNNNAGANPLHLVAEKLKGDELSPALLNIIDFFIEEKKVETSY